MTTLAQLISRACLPQANERVGAQVAEKTGDKAAKRAETRLAQRASEAVGQRTKAASTLGADVFLKRQSIDRPVQRAFGAGEAEKLDLATIKGYVLSLLPDTNPPGGLPHQHFLLRADAQSGGKLLRVDNDLKFGTRVPNLRPDQPLTIRGVLWHDDAVGNKPAADGIHWTHHRDVAGDAGFIETADGTLFQ